MAALVTDYELNQLGDGVDLVITPPAEALEQMDDFVRDMHTSSGLLDELAGGITLAEAEEQVLAYVREWVPEPRKAPLGGNTVATDRGFLARDMPELESYLHYRIIDVSSIKELSRRWYPRAYFNAPKKTGGHRALADIRESIAELRYYREAVFVPQPGPDSDAAKAIAARHQVDPTLRPGTPYRRRCRRPAGGGQNRSGSGTIGRRCTAAGSEPAFSHGGCSSAGRAPRCGRGCRGFKSRHSPHGNEPLTCGNAGQGLFRCRLAPQLTSCPLARESS